MKKTATVDLNTAAAEALVRLLPTTTPLAAMIGANAAPDSAVLAAARQAVLASFVGATSADVAVVVVDTDALTVAGGTDSPLVSVVDVLRPALEGAVGVLGAGVLGEAKLDDAGALFADAETKVFELTDSGTVAGWFAIRIRKSGTLGTRTSPRTEGSMSAKLGRINNVEMALTVEIGRTRMSVRDVLGLEPGAVIELDRSAGAPADVLLNGRLIAHGEVVVVDQDYAVRITQILDVDEGLGL
ncbi:MAG: flagellar motor switch protein FliN [Terrimesophilobacter sp.]